MGSFQINESDKQLRQSIWGIIVAVFAVFVLVILFFVVPRPSADAERQRIQAEGVAYQVFEIRKQALKTSRGPASTLAAQGDGQIGEAPDGKPYFYQILEKESDWVVKIWT